jgi:radical SAM superfamily enzyme YgiQ (UPF0313 family)
MNKYEVVIAAVPYVITTDPIMAPAHFKGILSAHGIQTYAFDLNIEIVKKLENSVNKEKLSDFFFSEIIHDDCIDEITELINYSVDRILEKSPKILVLSLLIYSCQVFTSWLCAALRIQQPDLKIVIGGAGVRNFIADTNLSFCNQLKHLGLINDFIIGDGDQSLYEYIQGNKNYPGINSTQWKPITDLNTRMWPDYDDYDFTFYDTPVIPINDSRGCIKNCEFCDIVEYWTKYQYRTAENIWEEMQHQIKKYNITKFEFRSSLVNGNLKEFKKLLDLMTDYNSTKSKQEQISWLGYFIIRGAKFHSEDLWEKIGKSNGTLMVGVESLIPHVRKKLGKTFENEDIDHDLNLGQKFQVPLILLLIVAYPTETLQDFEFTKSWFNQRANYANNSVILVSLSFASILPGTELERRSEEYGIKRGRLPSIWINQNLIITSEVRKRYLLELKQVCETAGFDTRTNEQTLENTEDEFN